MQNKTSQIIDYFISAAVLCQSILMIIELYMIDISHIEEDTATNYRVLLTAVPMSIALVFSFRRRPLLFVSTYGLVLLVILASSIFHPETSKILYHEAFRFTLPLVVGSALCLISVNNIEIITKTLYWMSYPLALLAAIYFVSLYTVNQGIQKYDMSFSYALLLPMAIMYSRKELIPLIVALLLFIMVILLGARGAALFFLVYVFFDLCLNNKKLILPFILLSSLIFYIIPAIIENLAVHDISSRTLNMLISSDHDNVDSGRFDIYQQMIRVLDDNFFFGIGLFGDRLYLNGHCHNFFLEILLDFGYLFGGLIILIFLFQIVYTYLLCAQKDRNTLLLFLICIMGPLQVSSSYLIFYNFGIFVGILFVLCNKSTQKNSIVSPINRISA